MTSMEEKLNERHAAKEQAKLAGGQAAVEWRHRQGRLTARERIHALVDAGSFQKLDLLLTSAVGFARLGGQVAGIVANNPMEMGGYLTVDASTFRELELGSCQGTFASL